MFHSWCRNGRLIISRAYDFFRTSGPSVHWYKVVSDRAVLPKHYVIASLAIQNALPTYTNLMGRGLHGPNCCVLCNDGAETTTHLFFTCPYSRCVIGSVKSWVKLMHTSCNLKAILWLLRHHFEKDYWRAQLARSAIVASIYFIWTERNARIFTDVSSDPSVIIKKIKFHTSVRLFHIPNGRSEDSRLDYLLD